MYGKVNVIRYKQGWYECRGRHQHNPVTLATGFGDYPGEQEYMVDGLQGRALPPARPPKPTDDRVEEMRH